MTIILQSTIIKGFRQFTKVNIMDTQGIRVKKIRQALDLSQEEFGAIFDIKKQFVSNIEKDRVYLNNDKLVKLLVDYNVNINYLLAGIGEMFITDKKAPQSFEAQVEDIFNKLLEKKGII